MRFKILFMAVVVCSMISQSCKKESLAVVATEQDELSNVKAALVKLGFDIATAIIKGEDIFVEEDILLKKSELFKTQPRQAVLRPNSYLPGDYKLLSFSYCISNTLSHHSPVQSAVDELRSILPSSIVLTRVFNEAEADLVFRGYTEISNICGYASWPTFDYIYVNFANMIVGESVNINLYNWRNLNTSQRKTLIAHELGHAIGIRHTNWRAGEAEFVPGVGGATYGAYTVPNTNNTSVNPDPSSIFNGNSCGRSWGNGFTQNDKRAIVYVSTGLTI